MRIHVNQIYVVKTYRLNKTTVRFMLGGKIKVMGLRGVDIDHMRSSDWHGCKARIDDGRMTEFQPVWDVNNATAHIATHNSVATLV